MRTTFIRLLITVLISSSLLTLSGCASGIASPVPGSPTVAEAYHASMLGQTTFSRSQDFYAAPHQSMTLHTGHVHLPVPEIRAAGSSARVISASVANTLNAQFPTIPNPQSVMYVFGHYAGKGLLPVAGHFVPFSLYTRSYYALPNEVLMPYNDGQFNQVVTGGSHGI